MQGDTLSCGVDLSQLRCTNELQKSMLCQTHISHTEPFGFGDNEQVRTGLEILVCSILGPVPLGHTRNDTLVSLTLKAVRRFHFKRLQQVWPRCFGFQVCTCCADDATLNLDGHDTVCLSVIDGPEASGVYCTRANAAFRTVCTHTRHTARLSSFSS